jgi:hypothetical protein
MKRHIHKGCTFSTYCGLSHQSLECTPIRESNHIACDWSKIATCKTCTTNRINDVEKKLKELEAELRVRKFQQNL